MRAVGVHPDAIVVTSRIWQTTATAIRAGNESMLIDSPYFPDELDMLPQLLAQAGFEPSGASGQTSRQSRWSQSPCVASNPVASQPAWASTDGSASSSSGRTGESTTKVSSPWWTSVQVVCQMPLTQTTTSGCSAVTRTARTRGRGAWRPREGS